MGKNMDKKDIYDLLKRKNIWHEITEHPAVYNMAEVSEISLPYPESDAKNLFLKDKKSGTFYLVTVRGNKRVDLKKFRNDVISGSLAFAGAKDLSEVLGLIPGAVTPFGLLNDAEKKVRFYIDSDFKEVTDLIGVHPNDNTATVWLKVNDLLSIIREHGNPVSYISL